MCLLSKVLGGEGGGVGGGGLNANEYERICSYDLDRAFSGQVMHFLNTRLQWLSKQLYNQCSY